MGTFKTFFVQITPEDFSSRCIFMSVADQYLFYIKRLRFIEKQDKRNNLWVYKQLNVKSQQANEEALLMQYLVFASTNV